jgi:hypothetical protein
MCSCLLLSVGCKREVPTSASKSPEVPVAIRPSSPDQDWGRIIVGSWVSRSAPPQGDPEDICATDTNFDFGGDGSYATSSDEGRWRLSGNRLIIAITASNPDGDIGPPMKKIVKPIAIHSRLISYKAPILTTITDGEKEYWYRCPKGTDANP